MSLARAWLRELSGASGVALVVPATIVVALALLGIAGGFGGLSALGQALAGPSVPREVAAVAASKASPTATLVKGRAALVAAGQRSHAVAGGVLGAPGAAHWGGGASRPCGQSSGSGAGEPGIRPCTCG